jgi:alpha-N-acetylglucosaminidase
MALNGINLPLAQSGNEYIWQKVWREYGLNDEQIRAYFTGPAQLPWHRMANIDKVGGPLPQSYIDGQHDLQKQILARERQLGMSPVLPAFAGHVPEALKTRQPAMKVVQIPPGWADFPAAYATWFLDPLDPRFQEIAARFLQEQTKEYGTSHYYGTDPFNEMTPPSWEPSYLANVARAIYRGMTQVDPGAIWLQMAWTFTTSKQWNDARLSAMIGAVPQGRMVLIDYVCENRELFRETKAFYGAPFIWDYLGNFGGNTFLVGPVNKINQRLTAAINDPALTNFEGIGATLEGFNNPVVYEMLFDRAWAGSNMDLSTWIRNEARARSGGPDLNVEKAWKIIGKNILVDNVDPIGGHGVIFQERDPSLRGDPNAILSLEVPYNNADLVRAWNLLLQARPKTRESSAYQRDLVDTTRQALGNIGLTLREQMAMAYDRKDAVAFEKSAAEFMTLGRDIDQFLAARTDFMLGKWIDDAKSWAANKNEQSYYERNARTILTVWGGGSLTDYAGRQWNGLLRDYYLPRWQILIDATLAELKGGKPVDRAALEIQWHDHNWRFATATDGSYSANSSGDCFAMSRALFEKYAVHTSK